MLVLDRFEGNIAIIELTNDETGEITMIKTERGTVALESREGDVLDCEDGFYKTNYEATEQRRKRVFKYLKNIIK